MRYKLILFDADGTLFDFKKAEKNAFTKTMNQFGVNENIDFLHTEYEKINLAIWQEFQERKISAGKLRIERFARFFENNNLKLQPAEISSFYLKRLSEGVDLIPSAEEIVRHFWGKCELAIATNGLSDVQRPRFAASKLAPYFKHIFISEEIGCPKPNPEYFEFIFRELPYQDAALIVGDNLTSDIKGGIDFGIDTCWFNPEKKTDKNGIQPNYEISDLRELKTLFR